MSYLLDTNVVSEVRRSRAAPEVMRWLDSISSTELFLSVLVVGEVRVGIERLRRRDPAQSAVLERWLHDLQQDFHERVIPIGIEIVETWGRIHASTPASTVDGLMAATAKVRGFVFVTRNVADVARTGVRVLNPWDPPTA